MINLMPPQQKEAILYARRNTFLIRWVFAILFAAAGIIIVTGGSLFYLKQDSKAQQASIDSTKASLDEQKEAETLKRVDEMSSNLKLVVNVLSDEVLFSKLLQRIGVVMPSGTVLRNLSVSSGLDGGIDLEIGASSYQAATQAQVNLADKNNGLFEKADIQSISCNGARAADPRYPCSAEIRALFLEDNQFQLLHDNKEGQ